MSEMAKTFSFLAAAAVAVIAGFATGPGDDEFDIQSEVGKKINQFTVDDAKSLRIVTFDKETATSNEFEVAEEDGQWTIPSKHGYPADAVRQMADAATCLIDREVLRVAAEDASLHAELGLIDPTSSNLSASSEGVGTRVTMTDIDSSVLTDMIIGKQVLDEEDQYYVRNADSDYAYVINLDPESLTTQFEDWIEKDLLTLNSSDVSRLYIKDYSAETVFTLQGLAMDLEERSEMDLRFDESENKWLAENIEVFDPDQKALVEQQLADDEELDQDALRDLKLGLSDLTIVDVERKPEGLSADLQAGEDFLNNDQALQSLATRGFSPIRGQTGGIELLSSEGEIICTLKTGVEYVLRFGNPDLDSEGGSENAKKDDPKAKADDGIHRYLFVMARLNKSAIPQPDLPELPELPEGIEIPAEESKDASEEKAAPAESKEETEPPAEGSEKTDESTESDATEETARSAEGSEASEESDTAGEPEKTEEDHAALIASYKLIQQERDRLNKEHEDKIKEAEKTVRELNERFGDWYYVIDNKVFKDVHLSHDDVVKKKKEEETADKSSTDSSNDSVPGLPNLPVGEQSQ